MSLYSIPSLSCTKKKNFRYWEHNRVEANNDDCIGKPNMKTIHGPCQNMLFTDLNQLNGSTIFWPGQDRSAGDAKRCQPMPGGQSGRSERTPAPDSNSVTICFSWPRVETWELKAKSWKQRVHPQTAAFDVPRWRMLCGRVLLWQSLSSDSGHKTNSDSNSNFHWWLCFGFVSALLLS